MKLYHYTSLEQYVKIADSGYIDLSPSNLLPPDRASAQIRQYPDGSGFYFWDKNQDYKNVVWLTSMEDPDPEALGLTPRKCAIRLAVDYNPFTYIPWKKFADLNRMDKKWRRAFEDGRSPNTWYVRSSRLPFDEITESVVIMEYCPEAQRYAETEAKRAKA